jgi:ubiquinone/menaquinone biosynthesis C-methylase UbiE
MHMMDIIAGLRRRLAGRKDSAPAAPPPPPKPLTVEAYWTAHTVNSRPFQSAQESLDYLQWRFDQYPLFREFMEMYGRHEGQVVLDYGCGPGNDVVGFLIHGGAAKVVGMDVSPAALGLARARLALHGIDACRAELVQVSDSQARVPLVGGSVDFVCCEGALQHASDPEGILREFHRVLKDGADARVMVYNRDSVWFHLYTAYLKMVVEGQFQGLTVEQAFRRNTDGEECPISRCYTEAAFIAMCARAGFQATFRGGYLSKDELRWLGKFKDQAIADPRLAAEHRDFLRELTTDANGYPLYRGKHAGIGAVYWLKRLP